MRSCVVLLCVATSAVAQRSDTVVRAAVGPVHAAPARLVEELSIGRLDGPIEYQFAEIASIAVARDGSILVSDRKTPAVRLFDRTGKYVRTYGRKGPGPGEYMQPTDVAFLPDGGVVVRDPRQFRVCYYAADGRPVRDVIVNSGFGDFVPNSMLADVNGTVWVRTGGFNDTLARYTRLVNGAIVDTVSLPHVLSPPNAVILGARSTIRVSFLPVGFEVFSPLGYWVTFLSNRYAIDLRIPRTIAGARPAVPPMWKPGDPVTSIRKPFVPVKVLPQERADHRSSIRDFARRGDPSWTWQGPDIPAEKAAFRRLSVDDEGRMWVQLFGTGVRDTSVHASDQQPWADRGWVEPTVFEIVEPSGRIVGRVPLPPRTYFKTARGDTLWVQTLDADDVPIVKRYRIVW
jgi:hypothetical protein